ncbi:MAG: hypothetical protein KGI66_03240, partial [Patescibacteria group bacterium]|nr:hypothetical protein [Patescibacteria group bacterium]
CLNAGSGLTGSGSINLMTYWTGSGSLAATGSPTVGYITATSSAATSSIAGNIAVGSPGVIASIPSSAQLQGGAVAIGSVWNSAGSGGVMSEAAGSLALGSVVDQFSGVGSIASQAAGSFAGGNVAATTHPGSIISSGSGSLAWGQIQSISATSSITASSNGSIALGEANGGNITSSGSGSFAGGNSTSGSITASGDGSFAFGNNVSATGTLSTAFGTGFSNTSNDSFMVGYSSTPTLTVNSTSVGIGTTSPWTTLSVTGASDLGNFGLAGYFNATNTSATSTFAGGLMVGNNGLVYDSNSGVTTISSLTTGNMSFETDAGAVNWVDLPIDSTPSNGTVERYSASLNGTPMLTVFGQADGAGNIINNAVGIGSTSPNWFLSVAGNGSFDSYVRASYFNATSSVASTFPYASTTAITATTASTTNLIVSNASTLGFASSTALTVSGTASTTNLVISSAGGTGTRCLQVGPDGTVSANAAACGAGAGSAAGTWSTTTSSVSGELVNYSNNNTDVVAIGNTSTTTAPFWFDPNALVASLSGKVGIGTTSPFATLSVNGSGFFGGSVTADSFNATDTSATSTLAGGLTVGTNGLVYDSYSGITTISALQTGGMSFPTDAGALTWTDLPIDSTPANGTVESYSADLNGNPMLTIFGQADGAGNIINNSVGIGTTSPFGFLSASASTTYPAFVVAQATSTNAGPLAAFYAGTNEVARISNAGYLGLGTTSPWTTLSVNGFSDLGYGAQAGYFNATNTSATSTFAGGLNVGNGAITYDWNSGTTSIPYLETGNMNFAADSGNVSWIDMPVTSASANGVENSYTANLNGNALLTVAGISNGSGGLSSMGVGVGTTSPSGFFAVSATSSTPALFVTQSQSSTANGLLAQFFGGSTEELRLTSAGLLGLSTTSPWRTLSVNGSSDLGTNALAGSFTATSSVASTFPYASSTALTVSGEGYFGTASTTNLIISSAGGSGTRCLQVGPDGTVSANSAACGGSSGSSGGTWSTTTSSVSGELVNYSNNNTDVVAIGNTSTTTAKYWFDPNALIASLSGKVGIGTTSPWTTLSVNGSSDLGNFAMAGYFNATNTSATSTLAGGLTVGTNGLVYDSYSGVTTISSLTTGNMNFETDAGAVTWTDLPIDSTPPNGTVESYSASLNGTPMLTIFGQADGAGNIINNAVGIGTTSPFGFLSASASTTYPAFVVAQATSTNAGPLAAFYAGTNEVARFSNAGYLGLGTTSPWTTLSVNGSSDLGNFAMAGYFNATNTSATSTFAGSVNIGNGSFVYDNTGGTTTISNLQLGNLSFDTDAGVVSAMDMPVDSSAAAGTPEAYNFNLNSSPVLTVYSQATGSGGVQNTAVGIGTTSPYALLSVAGQSEADYFYAASTTATSTFAGGLQANLLKVTSTTGTSTFAGFIDVNGTGTNATSTFASNLWVKGALKVGTASLYMTANGIFSTDGSIAISNPEMTGIATSTFQQLGTQVLNVSTTTATSTFANGINLSGGCFAVNGACVSGGSASLSGGTAGMLASWVSGSSLTATSGPTAAYYTATSTATSTFTGGLQVNLLNVTSTTATSTFANGINLTNGCFSVNGTCVGGDSGSGTVNSGTQGQIAFYNANGTAVSGTSSISITQSQLVGIGTTSPSMSKLSVDSGSNQTGFLVTGSVNNYLQSVLWNRNSGGTGSTDYILTNDLGSPGSTSYYADLGLNSSKNADSSYPITWANDAYLYNQDGGLILASATSTSNGRIVFAT